MQYPSYQMQKKSLFLQTLGCKVLHLHLCFQSRHCCSIIFTVVNFSVNKQTKQQRKNPRRFDYLTQFRINFHPSYALLKVHKISWMFENYFLFLLHSVLVLMLFFAYQLLFSMSLFWFVPHWYLKKLLITWILSQTFKVVLTICWFLQFSSWDKLVC